MVWILSGKPNNDSVVYSRLILVYIIICNDLHIVFIILNYTTYIWGGKYREKFRLSENIDN